LDGTQKDLDVALYNTVKDKHDELVGKFSDIDTEITNYYTSKIEPFIDIFIEEYEKIETKDKVNQLKKEAHEKIYDDAYKAVNDIDIASKKIEKDIKDIMNR